MDHESKRTTDLRSRLTPLGLGCVTFGREIDEATSFQMMDHAVEKGIRHFDTAAAYAAGASEKVVGAWFASRRPAPGSIVVATKFLPPYSAASIEEAVRASMERLGSASIDLMYLHRWHDSAAAPETLAAFDRLASDGRVKALGMSNTNAEQLGRMIDAQRALGFAPVSAIQNNNNVAVRDVDEPLRALTHAHNMAVITYSPLGAGFLTGKYRTGVPAGTRFDVIPGHQQVYFHEQGRRRLARLEALADRTGLPQAHLAIAWAMRRPGTATVLIGGRSTAQIDQAFTAQSIDPAIVRELDGD